MKNQLKSRRSVQPHTTPETTRKTPSKKELNSSQSPSLSSICLSPSSDQTRPADFTHILTKRHYFIKYRQDASRRVRKVFFTKNLLHLIIEKDEGKFQAVPTSEIAGIQLGFSKQMLALLINGEFNSRVYGFRLILPHNTIEMSCVSRLEREKWMQSFEKLVAVAHEWRSQNGLRLYWDMLMGQTSTQESAIQMQALQETQNDLIRENQRLAETIIMQSRQLQQAALLVSQKEKEVSKLSEDLSLSETRLANLCKSLDYSSLEVLPHLWLKILELFTVGDLLRLRGVSKFYLELVHKHLGAKANWRRLPAGGLHPRRVSWKLYFDSFYSNEVRDVRGKVSPQIFAEIQKDVARGLPDLQNEVTGVLATLCSLNPEIGYCQGMQLVAHFLLRKLRHTDKALRVILALMRPPYFLGDMWKSGMPRLRIALFQLEFLVKLKLPILGKHMKAVELKLDVVVSAWLLTVFVHLNAQQGFPMPEIECIWDHFLVGGWPALMSACLALLDLSQQYVIGESLEDTIAIYTNGLPFQDLSRCISRFEVDCGLLDDLERAYYLQ